MKLRTKAGIVAATAAVAVGAVAFVSPSFAHGANDQRPTQSEGMRSHADHNHASVEASITGIPSDITSLRDAVKGAYYVAYKLDDATLPSVEPTEGGRFIGVKPVHEEGEAMGKPDVSSGEFVGELSYRAGSEEGTTYFGLYPADGSDPVLVTVSVDADGVATATASAELSLSYSAEVADSAPEIGPGKMGHREGKGPKGPGHGMRGHGDRGPAQAPNA